MMLNKAISKDYYQEDSSPLEPIQIMALADEMHTSGFPEIAEVLVSLAYDIMDSAVDHVLANNVAQGCASPPALSGWMRA